MQVLGHKLGFDFLHKYLQYVQYVISFFISIFLPFPFDIMGYRESQNNIRLGDFVSIEFVCITRKLRKEKKNELFPPNVTWICKTNK